MNAARENLLWRGALFFLGVLAVLVCLMPAKSEAAPGYGTWNVNTGFSNTALGSLNENTPEMVSFACTAQNGRQITDEMRSALTMINKSAALIYIGDWDLENWGASEEDLGDNDKIEESPNLGIGTGKEGLRAYLAIERRALLTPNGGKGSQSLWSVPSHRKFFENQDDSPTRFKWAQVEDQDFWIDFDPDEKREADDFKDYFPFNMKQSRQMASYLNMNASNYYEVLNVKKLPPGCIDASFDNFDDLNISDIFDGPISFMQELVIGGVTDIASAIYGVVSKPAYKWAFFTPHTERGDLMWQITDNCEAGKSPKECTGDKEALGFNKDNLHDSGDRPFYLDLAAAIGWLTTGLYFIMLFAAAVVFIFRGSRSQTLQLMKLGPRILLALVMTIAAPFFIGAAITVSNIAVDGFMSFAGQDAMSSYNLTLSLAGYIVDPPASLTMSESLIVSLINLIVGAVATFAAVLILMGSILRQLVLVILVMVTPAAIFCSVIDSWRPKFLRWLRALGVIIFLPVVTGVILTIGMLINPLNMSDGSEYINGDGVVGFMANVADVSGGTATGTIGVIMVLITALAIAMSLKTGLSIAITNKNMSAIRGLGGAMQIAAPLANALPGGPATAAAIGAVGGAMKRKGGALGDKMNASLIPGGRETGAATGGTQSAIGGAISSFAAGQVAKAAPARLQKGPGRLDQALHSYQQKRQNAYDAKKLDGWEYMNPEHEMFKYEQIKFDDNGRVMTDDNGRVQTEEVFRNTTVQTDHATGRAMQDRIGQIRSEVAASGVEAEKMQDTINNRIQQELGLAGEDALMQTGSGYKAVYTQDRYDQQRGNKTLEEQLKDARDAANQQEMVEAINNGSLPDGPGVVDIPSGTTVTPSGIIVPEGVDLSPAETTEKLKTPLYPPGESPQEQAKRRRVPLHRDMV